MFNITYEGLNLWRTCSASSAASSLSSSSFLTELVRIWFWVLKIGHDEPQKERAKLCVNESWITACKNRKGKAVWERERTTRNGFLKELLDYRLLWSMWSDATARQKKILNYNHFTKSIDVTVLSKRIVYSKNTVTVVKAR